MNNQMNSAVRKIHNLLSSGAVTVTGPNQPRILKQKVVGSGVTATTVTSAAIGNNVQQHQQVVSTTINRCYVCDDALGANQAQHQLTEMQTTHTTTKFPNKIGQLVGDAFMVIVSVEDVVCSRCTNLINYLDRLENDVERVRTNLMNLLHKKYGLNDDSGGIGNSTASVTGTTTIAANVANNVSSGSIQAPPNKLQKLNSGAAVSAVQQMKISTQSPTNIQQQSAGTQTLQRKTAKIYKCLSCDYKTSDMRLFNTHYETCKHQNFQCKNCKRIFPNFGAMKQHMVREHNTPMDNTCAVCHINFVSEASLRKHMEINHSTNVVVTSTTTLPVSQNAAAPTSDPITGVNAQASQSVGTTSLYTCNHCQFKSTDKIAFDEHMRKHMAGVKSKPFKCRLCAQRFETREAATTHAKQHQGNVFKCGTCAMSFPKREMLVKHFEEHQQQQQNTQQIQQQPVQQQQMITIKQQQTPQTSQNILTTQKLLQETIDEALSDSTTPVTTTPTTDVTGASSANNIRFFSCHICSLTFIQENYYNQHMETHRRGDATSNTTTTTAATHKKTSNTVVGNNSLSTLNAAALLSEATQQESNELVHHNAELNVHHQQQQQQQHQQQSASLGNTGNNTISEADIESIFEKMHSDKSDANIVAATTTSSGNGVGGSNDQVVITSQAGSGGGITFNITIPGQESGNVTASSGDHTTTTTTATTAPVSVSIDMPMLDQPDESSHASTITTTTTTTSSTNLKPESPKPSSTGPVSMPSLDDDNEDQPCNTTSTGVSSENPKNLEEPAQHKTDQSIKQSATEDGEIKEENSTRRSSTTDQTAEGQSKRETTATTEAQPTDSVPAEESQHQHQDVPETEEQQQADEHHELASGAENAGADGEQQQQHVAMELDEAAMQAQVDGGQIKFILNESGQLLQLDNHILTDADGNQILVQDPEHIQQLLQSVGVLQSGEGLDGETLQMMTDANGQMVLVQGENNETQLIDASLLNAEGQLVIQQSQDGDGGAHVIGEDGTRIPVSVSYTEDGQPIVQVQQQVLEAAAPGSDGIMDKDGTVVEGSAASGGADKIVIGSD